MQRDALSTVSGHLNPSAGTAGKPKALSEQPSAEGQRENLSRKRAAAHTQREPLTETNTNLAMRSESPEKPSREDRAPKQIRPTSVTGEQNHLTTTNRPQKPSKRSKLHVHRHDDGEEQQPRTSVPEPLPEIKKDLTRHADVVLKATETTTSAPGTTPASGRRLFSQLQDPAGNDAKKATVLPIPTRNPKRKDRVDAATTTRDVGNVRLESHTVGTAGDEDVDWLFAPQKSVREPRAAARRTCLASKVRDSRRDVSDIDLDDLLSNIASFAREQTISGPVMGGGDALTVVGKGRVNDTSKRRKRM